MSLVVSDGMTSLLDDASNDDVIQNGVETAQIRTHKHLIDPASQYLFFNYIQLYFVKIYVNKRFYLKNDFFTVKKLSQIIVLETQIELNYINNDMLKAFN